MQTKSAAQPKNVQWPTQTAHAESYLLNEAVFPAWVHTSPAPSGAQGLSHHSVHTRGETSRHVQHKYHKEALGKAVVM